MSMIFSDIMHECRNLGARAVEWVESLIFREVFNQSLRIIYNIIQDKEMSLNINTGLYNTLSPYLFDARYHLTPTNTECLKTGKFNIGENTRLHEEHLESQMMLMSEKQEDVFHKTFDEDSPANDVLEKIVQEPQLVTDLTSKRQQRPSDSGEKKTLKKGKKKKKQKKKSSAVAGLSVFTIWLLEQKPLEGKKSKWQKKSVKKNKRVESARKSITPSDEIISESLALILTKQGHYLEAKKMLQKLLVKFPDKATHYKSEIDKLNSFM